jgi:hypothetical protein
MAFCRSDANESLTETLTYDNLNRLLTATVSASIAPVKTFTYDPIGNLLSKSDVCTYTYPLAGSMLPHAVSVVAGPINSTFTYDPNGTAGLGRSISYTSYNKPSSITQGSSTLFFSDDIDHQCFKQQAPEGTDDVNDALKNPTEPPIFQDYNDRWRYIGKTATIVLEQDGTLVTAWRSY